MNIFLIGNTILEFEELASTNDYALELLKDSEKKVENGLVIFTKNQTKGRGQRENSWVSEKDSNLTFSICLNQLSILVADSFFLSMAVAVAVRAFLKDLGLPAQIKWPNDIYVNNKKIAGILIENSLKGGVITQSVLGIGLNVNQKILGQFNATSVFNETQIELDLKLALLQVLKCIEKELVRVSLKKHNMLKQDYLQYLLGYKAVLQYRAGDEFFKAKVIDVKGNGLIELQLLDNSTRKFYFKEVALLLT